MIVNVKELATFVDQMRVNQRAYFRTRNSDVLLECKTLEHKVDLAVKAILDENQQASFDFDSCDMETQEDT